MSSTTDEESADEVIKTCATCRRDGERRCMGCHDTPDNEGRQMYTTYYCSTACQKMDYIRTHKYACNWAKNRRAVYRVGDIAQLAFYAYLEIIFDVSITKVEKHEDTLYLRQGKNDENLILPFPDKLFSDEEEKLAALTVLAYDNALGFVQILVEKMLGGLVQRVARVDHTPKSFKRRIILVSPTGEQTDNTTQAHAIIQATFQNDEQFAIDIRGVQHGHAKPVIPWQRYAKTRIEKIQAAKLLKGIEERKKQVGKYKDGSKVAKTREEEFAEVVGGAVDQWQARNGSVYGMIQSRDDPYQRNKALLLEFIDERVRKHKAHRQNNGRLNR